MTIKRRKAAAPPPEILARMVSMMRKFERPEGEDALSADIMASGSKHIDALIAKDLEVARQRLLTVVQARAKKPRYRSVWLARKKKVTSTGKQHLSSEHHYKKTA